MTLSRHQSHHVTDHAGQTWLLMLVISPWLCVWGAAVRHLPSILHNPRAALTARVVSHVHWSPAQTPFTNTHRPTRHPLLDKQRRSALIISTTVICCVTMLASDNWPCNVLWSSRRRPPTTTHIADRQGARRRGWSSLATGEGSDFNVVAHVAAYKSDIGDLLAPNRRCLACSDVAVFRCLMCTSAELYMILVTSSNGKCMWAAFQPP